MLQWWYDIIYCTVAYDLYIVALHIYNDNGSILLLYIVALHILQWWYDSIY